MRMGAANELRAIINGGTVSGLTDGELLERFCARRGEEAGPAFTALVTRHGPLVYGVCQSIVRNPQDAEDAFQATFLVLARKAGSVRRPELLGPWLHGVARRTARRLRDSNTRRKRREAEAAMSGVLASSDPSRDQSRQINHDEIEALHDEIDRLPQRYRSAVVLCDLEGLTHEEAALRSGSRPGTISSRLSRARERLRARLTRRGIAFPAAVIATAALSSKASAMPPALVGSTVKYVLVLSAGLGAGSVPGSVVSISYGVSRSMIFTKMGMITAAALGVGAVTTGVVLLAPGPGQQQREPKAPAAAPKPEAAQALEVLEVAGQDRPSETEFIVRGATNLRRIGSAIKGHFRAHNNDFPAAAIVSPSGTPLLSWRVAILPYLGESEKALYAQFHLNEPWDSPYNMTLLAKMPKIYAALKPGEPNVTHYLGFVGGGALFDLNDPVNVKSVTDGTTNTLMIAEAAKPVPWTKPEDLSLKAGNLLSKLGGQFEDGFLAISADGFPWFVKKTITPRLLDEIVTRAGGEIVKISSAAEGIEIP